VGGTVGGGMGGKGVWVKDVGWKIRGGGWRQGGEVSGWGSRGGTVLVGGGGVGV